MKKLDLEGKGKPGPHPKYKKVGSQHFLCPSCGLVKPLRQRHGKICCDCVHKRYVSTIDGALRYRYSMKKSKARREGIPFNLTFDEYKRQYEKQDGKDGYTGEQLCFEFGHGRSGATGSLDRIDNEKGYTPTNVVFCSLAINGKKSNKPVDQFMVQLELDFSGGVSDDGRPLSEEESE
jgi:hypothetical protein